MHLTIWLFLVIAAVPAFGEEWQMITDTRNVRDIAALDNKLWLATEGGLVEYSPSANHFHTFTTLDGLGGIGVSRLLTEDENNLWIALDNKILQRWNRISGVTHTISTISQQEGVQSLNDLLLDDRGLFVATSRGIAVITFSSRYNQWVWYEEYRTLGNFDQDSPVRAILIEGDTIWAATSLGVAKGNLNSPPPLDWVNYTVDQGLPDSDIRDIIRVNGTIYVSTENGSARFNGNRWERLHQRRDVYRLFDFQDTLTAITSDGLSWWDGTNWNRYGSMRLGANVAVQDPSGVNWLGFSVNGYASGGLAVLSDTSWVHFIPSGPLSNGLLAAQFFDNGEAFFVGGRSTGEYGLCKFGSDGWTTWTYPEFSGSIFQYQNKSITSDKLGGVWVGSFGGGVARFDSNGDWTIYNSNVSTGSRVKGYEGRPETALTPAVCVDQQGNVWIVNRGAANGYILVCVPSDFIAEPDSLKEWYYYHRSNFRSFSEFDLLTIDGYGRKWIASSATNPSIAADQGVYVFDDNGTLADSSDDQVWGPLPGLASAEVYTLKYDPAGYIWVGSPGGAYYISATAANYTGMSLTQIYNLRDIPIYGIDVDYAGNKWFATEFGVSVLAPDLWTILQTITNVSPHKLPDERVNMVAIDPYSGNAYLATQQGMAVMQTPYRDYGDNIGDITFEPNPFNPEQSRLIFTGSSLAANAGVRIFTPDGRLIRKMSHNEAALGWDGRDDSGRGVAEGVYLILTYSGSGQAGKGKVAVIRR